MRYKQLPLIERIRVELIDHSQFWVIIAVGSIAVAAAYFPYILWKFGHHNDYRVLTYRNLPFTFNNPESMAIVALGRLLNAILYNIYLGLFPHDIRYFAVGRVAGLATMLLFGTSIAVYLHRRLGQAMLWSATLAFGVIILPAGQLFVLYLSMFVPGPLTSLLGLAGFLLVDDAYDRIRMRRWQPVDIQPARLALALGFGLLFAAMFIYPPSALVFLSISSIRLMYGSDAPIVRWTRSLADATLAFFAMGGMYFMNKLLIFPLFISLSPWFRTEAARINADPTYRFSIDLSGFGRKFDLFFQISRESLELWNVSMFRFGFVAGALVIALGAMVCGKRMATRDGWSALRTSSGFFGCWLLLLGMSLTPTLLSDAGENWYRSQFAFALIVTATVWWGVGQVANLAGKYTEQARSVAGICLVLGGISLAAVNVRNVAANDVAELQAVRNALLPRLGANPDAVAFFSSLPKDGSYTGRYLRGEFGWTATYPFFVPEHYNGLLNGRAFRPMSAQQLNDPSRPIALSTRPIFLPVGSVVVDLESLRLHRRQAIPLNCLTDASSSLPDHPVTNLFIGDANVFWQASQPAPQSITYTCSQPFVLVAYQFFSGPSDETSIDLPQQWILEGSNDGRTWDVLDRRDDRLPWNPNENRVYRPQTTPPESMYRFVFSRPGDNVPVRVYELRLTPRTDSD